METGDDDNAAERGYDGKDRHGLEELSLRKSIAAADVERQFKHADERDQWSFNRLMVHFANCFRVWKPNSWQLERLDLAGADSRGLPAKSQFALEEAGLAAVIEILENARGSLRELRLCIRWGRVSSNSMERLLEVLRARGSGSLQAFHLGVSFPPSFNSDRPPEERFREDMPVIANRVADVFAEEIASRRLENLEDFTLNGLLIGGEGISRLAKALGVGHLRKLQWLDLSYNDLGDMGVTCLAGALQSGLGRNLTFLGLAGNYVGDSGIEALAGALDLGQCPRLLHLCLHENRFRDGGLVTLAKAFTSGNLRGLETVTLYGISPYVSSSVVTILRVLEDGAQNLLQLRRLFLFKDTLEFEFLSTKAQTALTNFYRRNTLVVVKFAEDVHPDSFSCGIENLRQDNEERVERLKVLQGRELPGRHGKLFFCGNPRVGKTSLRVTLTTKEEEVDDSQSWRVRLKNELKNKLKHGVRPGLKEEEPAKGDKMTHLKGKREGRGEGVRVTTGTRVKNKIANKMGHGFHRQTLPPEEQEPTRGIEVTHLETKGGGTTIALWDLAGEHEFEVLHGAFLSDSKFSNGQATFFVIVCDARSLQTAKPQLRYWMRFISSSSVRDLKVERQRRVFVVLNTFCSQSDRDPVWDVELSTWVEYLVHCKGIFKASLNLREEPFVIDVKTRSEVEVFEGVLMEEAKKVLEKRKMPEICQTVQEAGREWVRCQRTESQPYPCPVLRWDEYRRLMGGHPWYVTEEKKLEAAAEYLHEAGHIIVFGGALGFAPSTSKGVVPIFKVGCLGRLRSLQNIRGEVYESQPEEGLVIVDPEWFCKELVGNLLLPSSIVQDSKENSLDAIQDQYGVSIPISTLRRTQFQVPQDRLDQVVMILTTIGVCYRLPGREEELFVPALVDKVKIPGWSEGPWKGTTDKRACVMGFSLKVKNTQSALLPIAILRKLQVEVALDEAIGKRPDLGYTVRRFSVSFKFDHLYVLIEYSDEEQDRIDILVKPAVSPWSRGEQMNAAQEFVNRINVIVKDCAHGVQLEKLIVQPWSVAEGWKPLKARNVKVLVSQLIERLEREGKISTMGWEVQGEEVGEEELLSALDLARVHQAICKRESLTKEAVKSLTSSSTKTEEDKASLATAQSIALVFATETLREKDIKLFEAIVYYMESRVAQPMGQGFSEVRELQQRTWAGMADMKGQIEDILDKQSTWNLEIQNLERFLLGDKDLSIPRFVYLAEKGSRTWWVKLNERFVDKLVLRFLCERSAETGVFHEVPVSDQDGVDVKKIKDWAKVLLPWVVWTLKAAFVASKIACNAVFPGLGILLGSDAQLSSMFSNFTTMAAGAAELTQSLFEALDAIALQQSQFGEGGVEANEASSLLGGTELSGYAKDAVRRILYSMNEDERRRQVGLRRVFLEDRDVGSGEKHVVWICNDCFTKYESRRPGSVHDLPIS